MGGRRKELSPIFLLISVFKSFLRAFYILGGVITHFLDKKPLERKK